MPTRNYLLAGENDLDNKDGDRSACLKKMAPALNTRLKLSVQLWKVFPRIKGSGGKIPGTMKWLWRGGKEERRFPEHSLRWGKWAMLLRGKEI